MLKKSIIAFGLLTSVFSAQTGKKEALALLAIAGARVERIADRNANAGKVLAHMGEEVDAIKEEGRDALEGRESVTPEPTSWLKRGLQVAGVVGAATTIFLLGKYVGATEIIKEVEVIKEIPVTTMADIPGFYF